MRVGVTKQRQSNSLETCVQAVDWIESITTHRRVTLVQYSVNLVDISGIWVLRYRHRFRTSPNCVNICLCALYVSCCLIILLHDTLLHQHITKRTEISNWLTLNS